VASVPCVGRLFGLNLRGMCGYRAVLSFFFGARRGIAFDGPIAMSERHAFDGLAIHGGVGIAHSSIDFVAVWKEVDIGWPACYLEFLRKVAASIGVYFHGNKVLVHFRDQGRIVKRLFVEQLARRTGVSIKMEQDDAVGGSRSLDSGLVVFGPGDFTFHCETQGRSY
jgi:hypothetical protein